MATEILRPNAAGDNTELSCSGTNHEACGDNSDSTYVYNTSTSSKLDLYNIPSLSSGVSSISKVTIYGRIKAQTDLDGDARIFLKSNDTEDDVTRDFGVRDSWYELSKEMTTNPVTGNAWTEDDIDNLQIGCKLNSVYGDTVYCSDVWIVVDYIPVNAPTVTNDGEANLAATSVTFRGSITDTGGQNASSMKFVYKEGSGGTEVEVGITGDGSAQQYTCDMTGLSKGTQYYYKFVAENDGGESETGWDDFTTLATEPEGTYDSVSDETTTGFTLNGTITDDGGVEVITRGFQVGLTKDTAIDYTDDGSYGEGSFSKDITGLSANTTYWIRVKLVNSEGTYLSDWYQVTTAAQGSVPTNKVLNIVSDYGGYGYNINQATTDDGETYTGYFEFTSDLLQDQLGIMLYKRLLELWIYINTQSSGSITLYIKRDTESSWQNAGSFDMNQSGVIARVHLPVDYRAIVYQFKLESSSYFEFLGLIGGYRKDGFR